MASDEQVRPRRRRRRGRASKVERYLPLFMVVATMLAAAIALPTTLRPPAQQPNQTAELSPDAPPDKDQQAIISSLNRATSGVPTDSGEGASGGTPTTAVPAPTMPPTTLVPRACPSGFGNPVRQIESVYSALCAAPWTGDNGGATSFGVTANEIRIGVAGDDNRGGDATCDTNGPVQEMAPGDRNAAERTFYVLQQYFNKNMQLYGRQLNFICSAPESGSETGMINAARALTAQYKMFGVTQTRYGSAGCNEYARLKVVCFTDYQADSFYRGNHPYTWGSQMSGTEIYKFWTEYWCKKLNGKRAEFGGPDVQSAPRKFGLVTYDTRGFGVAAEEFKRRLRETCGIEVTVIYTSLDNAQGQQQAATAIARFKSEGVTTIGIATEFVTTALMFNAANSSAYEPEWFVGDLIIIAQNEIGHLQDPKQQRHAFGLRGLEMELRPDTTECYRAYRTISGADNPDRQICEYYWRVFPIMMSGIQNAGPDLTPQTFAEGLYKLGMRYYSQPSWAMGGGYAPGTWTYSHSVAELWWDATAEDPTGNYGGVGAYRYPNHGRRLCLGQLDSDTSKLFREGISVNPDQGNSNTAVPQATCPPV